jgi:hypothetical protein
VKTSSCKAKGRKACQEVKALLHKFAPDLQDGDIGVTPSGVTGPDLHLSPAAREIYPYATECKNQERIQIWDAYEQAQRHSGFLKVTDLNIPIVFFRRNRSQLMVCLSAEDFLKLSR